MGLRQTRDGYLWITTPDGVARFDGVRFTVFNKSNTPGLPSNRFSYFTLWEDRRGALWMGTEDAGLVRAGRGRAAQPAQLLCLELRAGAIEQRRELESELDT
ncbi:MAG: hypothetical protein ACREEM_09590 [Blastocatellia bacterium]